MFQTSSIWAWFQGTKMGWKDHWTPPKRVYWNSVASNGKATKNSSPEPNYHQHPWISQLVWTPNEEYFVGWENRARLEKKQPATLRTHLFFKKILRARINIAHRDPSKANLSRPSPPSKHPLPPVVCQSASGADDDDDIFTAAQRAAEQAGLMWNFMLRFFQKKPENWHGTWENHGKSPYVL